MRIRVRGIYATALTRLLAERGEEVVQASEPIRDRFEDEFAVAPADCTIETASDRRGVSLSGDEDAVTAGADPLADLAHDAFVWRDPTPLGAVYEGRVRETRGGGAVVALGDDRAGYLPFDSADGYVSVDDRLRVQVVDPRPPWDDDLPELSTGLCVPAAGALASLIAGSEGVVDAPDEETARLSDLLSVDVPDGWGIAWSDAAGEADLDALEAGLERATERARGLDAALDSPSDGETPRRVAEPLATRWCWLGRDARFALDEHRRTVTATMPGHHRIKAAADRASAAVDFAEAVCEPEGGEFPFGAVTRQFGPREGDAVAIEHGKPDGRRITLGRGEVSDWDPSGRITVRREMTPGGSYDALDVEREAGDVAVTTLTEGRWWYPTVYKDDRGERKGTYVHVCTPVELFPDAARYVDLYVDVVRHADGRVERVDDDELDAAVEAGTVSTALADRTREVAASIERGLRE